MFYKNSLFLLAAVAITSPIAFAGDKAQSTVQLTQGSNTDELYSQGSGTWLTGKLPDGTSFNGKWDDNGGYYDKTLNVTLTLNLTNHTWECTSHGSGTFTGGD